MASNRTNIHPARAGGFSLIEMMAVLVILAILLALGVPAIRSMIYSSERSLAENQLRVAMTAARDAAVRSGGGDAAAVFLYQDNRTVIIPCVSVATIADQVIQGGATSSIPPLSREVFVPVEGIEPIRMPQGWNVRGYAAPGVIATGTAATDNQYGWMDCPGSMPLDIAPSGHWVFPETHFLDLEALDEGGSAQGHDEGWKRSTFMVRFEAGTGNASLSSRAPVLVLDPLPILSEEGFRNRVPYNHGTLGPNGENDPTQAATLESFVRQMVVKPQLRAGNPPAITRLIGDASPDTVLAMPVTEIALYDEARMASAIGVVRLNAVTQCLYAHPDDPAVLRPIEPTVDVTTLAWGANPPDVTQVQERIDAYITRDAHTPRVLEGDPPFEARVFTIQRYMGQMTEVSPEVE